MVTEKENKQNIPAHVAIIPDGNRRWAKNKGLPSLEGHRKGAQNFEKLADKAREMGIQCFTTWVFSTENWKRPQDEIDYLFDIARKYVKKYKEKCLREKTRFIHLGRKDRLPEDIVRELIDIEEKTKEYTSFNIALGFDYGGHDEIVRAVEVLKNKNLPITMESIENNLDTKGLPPPDFIIRTSGELRLSGFLSWQSAYAELYFPNIHFPDFTPELFEKAVLDFAKRDRRFGGNSK